MLYLLNDSNLSTAVSLNSGKILEVETVLQVQLARMLRRLSGSAAHAACQARENIIRGHC